MRGVVAMLDGDGIYDYAQARDWADARFPEMAFTPSQVTAAAAPRLDLPGREDRSGIYFLIRNGRICYVGKAKELSRRVTQHRKQGRPFDAVAAIVGVHWEFVGEVEAAYVTAWQPPWNLAPVHGGPRSNALAARLSRMDRSLICALPEHAVTEAT